MAQLIKANGEVETIKPKNGTDFSLEELQGYVGGYIEIVQLHKENTGHIMVVNEEGKLHHLPINHIATALYGLRDTIVGDVVVCETNQVQ